MNPEFIGANGRPLLALNLMYILFLGFHCILKSRIPKVMSSYDSLWRTPAGVLINVLLLYDDF